MRVRFSQLAVLVVAVGAVHAQDFESRRVPLTPGQRQASVVVPRQGVPRGRIQVWLRYSENQTELGLASAPRGRASCRSIDNDRLKCTFIFPHLDHPTPNILTVTEINGGEPPEERPTLLDVLATQAQPFSPPQFVITDVNARRIGAPTRVFYRWQKIVTGTGGSTTNDIVRDFAMARLFIVANMGESYASGEGAPNRNLVRTLASANGALDNGEANIFADEPMWEDKPCHQSEESGQERGVRSVIRSTPGFAIRFKNVACSGATINHGAIGTQTIDPNTFMDPFGRRTSISVSRVAQTVQLDEWLSENNRNTVDLLLLSIGGNDVGFGTVGRRCLIDNIASECRNDQTVTNLINTQLPLLPTRLDALRNDMLSRFNIEHVVHFGYPDPTRDSQGNFCRPTIPVTQTCWGALERSVSQADFQFIFNGFLTPLNTALANFAADTPDWEFVPTANRTTNHGLCNCSTGFFNTVGQSDTIQGDLWGSIHPNRSGHREVYQPLTEDKLRRRLVMNAARAEAQQRNNPD